MSSSQYLETDEDRKSGSQTSLSTVYVIEVLARYGQRMYVSVVVTACPSFGAHIWRTRCHGFESWYEGACLYSIFGYLAPGHTVGDIERYPSMNLLLGAILVYIFLWKTDREFIWACVFTSTKYLDPTAKRAQMSHLLFQRETFGHMNDTWAAVTQPQVQPQVKLPLTACVSE